MPSSKHKRIVKIFATIILFVVLYELLTFMLFPIINGHWVNHERKKYSKKIDTVFLGNSCTPWAYDPNFIDKELSCFSFNAGTSAQPNEMTYYIAKDLIKTSDIKTVFFSIDFFNFQNTNENDSFTSYVIALDRIKNPFVKIECINDLIGQENAYKIVFPSFFYNENSFIKIPETVKEKLSEPYINYSFNPNDTTHHVDRGYFFTSETGGSYNLEQIDLKSYDESCMDWLIKIVKLCTENNIEINIIHSPFTADALNKIKNRDFFNTQMKKLAKEYGFRYYDFNDYYEKNKLNDSIDFKDCIHLNTKGSQIYMKWFCKVFSVSDTEATNMFT